MNRKIIKDEVQWLIEAINEQMEAVKSYEARIPQIEMDMLMENVRKLYENLHLLDRINDSYDILEQKSREAPVIRPVFAAKTEENSYPDVRSESRPELASETDPVAEEFLEFDETSPVLEEVIPEESTKVKIEYGPAKAMHKPIEAGPEGDLFSTEEFGFTQKLKEARDKIFGPKNRKDSDLKSSISINDKFLFINELFDGNLREYNENIETLNGFHDLKPAFEYMELLRLKNRWESDGKGFKRLKELVERQFE